MFRTLIGLLGLTAAFAGADAMPQSPAVDRAVAVTFDDLPATPTGVVANDPASLDSMTRTLLEARFNKSGLPGDGARAGARSGPDPADTRY